MDADRPPTVAGDEQIEAWIEQAKAGSLMALGQLLEACHSYLLKLARQKVSPTWRGKVSASDLVQETSLDAHRGFVEFRGERLEELLAWLRQILLFNAANANRRYAGTEKRRASREVPIELNAGVARDLQDDRPSPRSLLAEIEEEEKIRRALDRLTEDYKKVILLRNRDHCSFIEIGVKMDRSAEAARKLWFRAIERLQQVLLVSDESV